MKLAENTEDEDTEDENTKDEDMEDQDIKASVEMVEDVGTWDDELRNKVDKRHGSENIAGVSVQVTTPSPPSKRARHM